MPHPFLPIYAYRLISILVSAAIISWISRDDRAKPDDLISHFIRHRDRVWFAILLLPVPSIANRLIFLNWFWPPSQVPALVIYTSLVFSVISGLVYGLAACLFTSPGKRKEPLSVWIALAVAIALNFLVWTLFTLIIRPRNPRENLLPLLLIEGVLILSYGIWCAVRGKEQPQDPAPESDGAKKKYDPTVAIFWLFVGIAPIPLVLILASSNPPNLALGPLLFIVPICNLCGGIGCLGGIKNVATRIILGIFLAAFFFCLTVIVAVFQACSHSTW